MTYAQYYATTVECLNKTCGKKIASVNFSKDYGVVVITLEDESIIRIEGRDFEQEKDVELLIIVAEKSEYCKYVAQ